VVLIERVAPASLVGHKLAELEDTGLARAVAVSRLGVSQMPTPALVLQEGDVLYLAVGGDDVDTLDGHLAGTKAGGH
jgi:Trk K+ transport system NAD-binding subunit